MIESPRHELDAAIDRVAAQMVEAPVDDGLLSRTLARLPERSAAPWFLTMPVQLTAGTALILVAFVFARQSREATSSKLLVAEQPFAFAQPLEAVPHPAAASSAAPRSLTTDSRSLIRDRADHEHSLAPVEALTAIALESIGPAALGPETAVVVAPIVLTELTLAGESSTPDR